MEEVRHNGTLAARYKYLADGTKLEVSDALGGGYLYFGSLIYHKLGDRYEPESVGFSGGRIVGTSTGSQVRYHVTDYLGSVRVVADADGKRLEKCDYYPFGKRIEEVGQPLASNRYQFNGKELQVTGGVNLLDYGARMYDPNKGRWLVQDPKYQFMNPYHFCYNNPMLYVDPDGRILVLYFGNERLNYIPGMTYTGTNSRISNIIRMLNTIYENGGYKVLKDLTSSTRFIYEINGAIPGNAAAGASFGSSGAYRGALLAGLIKEFNYLTVAYLAHELFHAIQHMNGQFGASIFNEVEAYVFCSGILQNSFLGSLSCAMGNDNPEGPKWEAAFNALLIDEYSWTNMQIAVDNFLKGSQANLSGIYNKLQYYPAHPKTKQLQSMIQKYWTPMKY